MKNFGSLPKEMYCNEDEQSDRFDKNGCLRFFYGACGQRSRRVGRHGRVFCGGNTMILYNITGRDKARRRQSLLFLLRLGIGWICGMGLSVTLLAGLFSTHIYAVSSLFLGLVAASIPLVAAEEKKLSRRAARGIYFSSLRVLRL